ncbi:MULTISPECIES: hypothetical protein [unclassified Nostoc]|uniref:hypothetical protein n=1 Tax=unclassified Nostoc TaxID=2593658 RepID=UPI002AD3F728|nr:MULTISPECIES: hypothetical protein [unclassified Nostoc]MDZ8126406.1 hypothetical protein [Nostoc sp. CmiVER01]MDZ8222941.1 hypothetical protein [Nostoc sp. ChiVER01]
MNYIETQASYARKNIEQRLENFIDAVDNDKSLSPDIKDQLVFLRYADACELTSITSKFRQQLSISPYIHSEVEKRIGLLDISIQHWARLLDINTLFLCNHFLYV